MWQTPKTNWTRQEYNNPADFNRQTGNIEHIANVTLPSLAYWIDVPPIPPVDWGDDLTAAVINALEAALTEIAASGVPLPDDWQPPKTWENGETAPDYTDANRWEGNVLAVYDMAGRVAKRWRPAGTFAAGQANILPRRVM